MYQIDKDYIVRLRREIHEYPELELDLPRTIAVVKRELEVLGITYTEKYGKSSVVGYINPEKTGFTIGIRADMDALPINEINDVPYKSKLEGKMHACGHDAHTAMLLGTAKALKAIEDRIHCRVMLLFQPSEEGSESGAELMVQDGIMDDIDVIIGVHIDSNLNSGCIGVCKGAAMASSRSFELEFFGRSAHAALPHSGNDALAAAVDAYNGIHLMLSRKLDPFAKYICCMGSLHAGTADNVVADYAKMLGTIRAFDPEIDELLMRTVDEICGRSAENFGCTYELTTALTCNVVYNDPHITDRVLNAASKVVGEDKISLISMTMSSEDFAQYQVKKPGVFLRLGTRKEEKGITTFPHNNDFMLDEDALDKGSATCVQFVLDNMNGIDF